MTDPMLKKKKKKKKSFLFFLFMIFQGELKRRRGKFKKGRREGVPRLEEVWLPRE
jgi:hypothetical protein